MRKFLSLLLAVLMIASLSGIAFADETTAVGTPRTETLIVETQMYPVSSTPICRALRWASAFIS